MTETATPQAAPAAHPTVQNSAAAYSPLAALLTQAAAGPELTVYRGALTPRELDAPQSETAALATGVAVHDLGWLRRVAVRGEDRFRWLSGMVTNTVNDLAVDSCAWNLVLNAQGRIQGDLHVSREADELYLTIAADQYERLLAHLERFIIMDDVDLAAMSQIAKLDAGSDLSLTGQTALGVAGPQAGELLTRLGLPAPAELTSARAALKEMELCVVRAYGLLAPHYELWVQAAEIPVVWRALVEAGATPVGAASLEAFRIAEAIPAYGIDMAERDLPQETSQMRALSFSKGCYLGQEIVERIRSRGAVHRHLRPLELFGPVPPTGAGLTLEDGVAAGQITSAAELPLPNGRRVFALGMIRGEAEIRNRPLSYIVGESKGMALILTAPPSLGAG
jgi:folate-binding protein YgfZ